MLERLPLTPNGKLDRKALPIPDIGSVITRAYEAPVGEIEIAVALEWQDILKLERISRQDNFFELGGHSLLAVMLRSRLRRALQIDITLKDIFAHPVLKAMAQVVKGIARSELMPIVAVSRDDALPLSFAQQGLWILAQMPGVSEAYHIPLGMRLKGDLDRHALRRALDRIAWRHEVLRTSFRQAEDQAVQQVEPADSGFALRERDLCGQAEVDRELDRRIREEASLPFDLQRGPLIRGELLKLAEQEHALLITMHHIVSDGWSLEVFVRELSELYAQFRAGQPDPLAPLPVQYADYAVWQRQWLKGERLESQRQYWQRTLQGAPGLLEAPADHPRPAEQQFAGGLVGLTLDATLTRGLKALSQRHGMTLYMTVLAGWTALLSRLSGQEEVVVGTPVANRTRTEIEGLIGFFVNTQALRIQVSGSVSELLEGVKVRTLEAQENQELPFEQVVDLLKAPRLLSHTPVFQVMLTWQNGAQGGFDLPGLTLAPIEVPYGAAKFDLELELSDVGDRVVGALRYATALFDRITMQRHVGYLRRLLTAMVADEQRRVDEIDILGEEERHQLLVGWNDTRASYPLDRCIHELIEEQAAKTPNAVAVICEGRSLRYAELNGRANQLAHYLRDQGVGPDQLVGICVERGLEMIVGLLGILKAGGAYVPLDPSYPSERLVHVLTDAMPKVLLIQEKLRERVPHTAEVIALDSDWDRIAQHSPGNLDAQAMDLRSDHLAYVIYTSGSTGRPKGVAIEHRNAVNLICWARHAMPGEVFGQALYSTSLNFDLSVYECFVPLATGGSIRVVENALAVVNEPAGVTLINTVPSAVAGVLNSGSIPAATRVVNLAGEVLKKELVDRIFAHSQVEVVCNLYGPSETTTYSTWISMPRQNGFIASIGRPIANTQIYILDGRLQPVPIGLAGEIYIGGAGVARGYLKRAELTAQRFVSDPFSAVPQARMYKTGDLGRWRSDGTIE
jgi:amino acid adenylation domain-containing protein